MGHDLNLMSRQDNEQKNNLSHNMKRGEVTKTQWQTKEMMSRHKNEVVTQNAVESKTVRSRQGTEVATHNLLRG